MPQFIEALTKLGSPSALAVAFSIVTASRFKAVRCAEWSEIDLKNKVWNIPEEHDKMKGRRMRQVLLSDEAIELLSYLPRVNNYLFPSGSHSWQVIRECTFYAYPGNGYSKKRP